MLEKIVASVRSIALTKNINIEVDINPNIGSLNGDKTRLKQVLYNLLSNALKFSEPGAKIGITADFKGNFIIIKVWDLGIGIGDENLKKIFEPFEQIKNAKIKSTGTGLGLAIVKRIIELHNGTIAVKSKVNEGTCFTIELPGKENTSSSRQLKDSFNNVKSSTTINQDGTILVVEDNEINLELVAAFLDELDYKADFTNNAKDAIEKVKNKEYSLIFMDIQMPIMNGLEALKHIRLIEKCHIPIIALTANAMKGDKYKAQGFDEYISKPINFDVFKTTINNILKLK